MAPDGEEFLGAQRNLWTITELALDTRHYSNKINNLTDTFNDGIIIQTVPLYFNAACSSVSHLARALRPTITSDK